MDGSTAHKSYRRRTRSTPAGVLLANSAMVSVTQLRGAVAIILARERSRTCKHFDRRDMEPLPCIMAPTSNLEASRRLRMLAGLAGGSPSVLHFLNPLGDSRTTYRRGRKRRFRFIRDHLRTRLTI